MVTPFQRVSDLSCLRGDLRRRFAKLSYGGSVTINMAARYLNFSPGLASPFRLTPIAIGWINDGLRRILLLAAHPGERRLTKPTAVAQAWRPELVFMPRSGRSLRDQVELKGSRKLASQPERSFAWRRPITPLGSETAARSPRGSYSGPPRKAPSCGASARRRRPGRSRPNAGSPTPSRRSPRR
jgi:hypothetical protein